MQPSTLTVLRHSLANERIEGYRRRPGDPEILLLTRYLWNMALSEALYPLLSVVEIALRNNLHNIITADFGNSMWFDSNPPVLEQDELDKVAVAKRELQRSKKPIEAGRLVAELNFGFWTSLLNARYETRFWPKFLKQVFPGMQNNIRTRKILSTRFNEVRKLRNRVFHHEPIWYSPNLVREHASLLETISWLNPTLRETTELVDRFPEVHRSGLASAEHLLETFLRGKGYII